MFLLVVVLLALVLVCPGRSACPTSQNGQILILHASHAHGRAIFCWRFLRFLRFPAGNLQILWKSLECLLLPPLFDASPCMESSWNQRLFWTPQDKDRSRELPVLSLTPPDSAWLRLTPLTPPDPWLHAASHGVALLGIAWHWGNLAAFRFTEVVSPFGAAGLDARCRGNRKHCGALLLIVNYCKLYS